MKIEITERIDTIKIIDIELPYYYEHDLSSEHSTCITYGKITETKCTTIQESFGYGKDVTYEIQEEYHVSIKKSGLASYFKSEYQSCKEDYEAVKDRALKLLNNI